MQSYKGFYDLNINSEILKDNWIAVAAFNKLYEYGYRTIAINYIVKPQEFDVAEKKKRKFEPGSSGSAIPVPAPIIAAIPTGMKVLNRLTIVCSVADDFYRVAKDQNIKHYAILSILPSTPGAFQFACSAPIDLIAYDHELFPSRIRRQHYRLAVEEGIFFELTYSSAVMSSVPRKSVIQAAHNFHFVKSKNVIITSGTAHIDFLRGPYDVIHLAFLFGLSQLQAKEAISQMCYRLLARAEGRQYGKVTVVCKMKNNDNALLNSKKNEDGPSETQVKKVKA